MFVFSVLLLKRGHRGCPSCTVCVDSCRLTPALKGEACASKFPVTVFVVSTGAGLAGYDPSGDFVVLSASLLVIAALFGGLPIARGPRTQPERDDSGQGFY